MSSRPDHATFVSAVTRAPMVRIAVPLVAGVLLARVLPMPPLYALLLLLAASGIALHHFRTKLSYSARWQRGVVLLVWALTFGLFWTIWRAPANDAHAVGVHVGEERAWLVRLVTLNRVTQSQLRADAEVVAFEAEGHWQPVKGRIMLTVLRAPEDPQPRVGDRLVVKALMKEILRIPDPGGFDRRLWAAARGVELELFATRQEWRPVDHIASWTDHFLTWREQLSRWVDGAGLPAAGQALVKALVLGQRDELDAEQRTAFARSGTIHVLAVSGMHVGLIYAILRWLTGWWGRRSSVRLLRGLLVLVALWSYAGITGGSPSVLRATVMFSFISLADMTMRRTDHLNSLFAALLLLLLWDPAMIGIIGFQLSFLAVLGIVLFQRPLENLLAPRTWLLRNIWSLVVLSISAQVFTTPLSLYYFKAFPVWFIPANLVVVTAVVFAVWASIAMLLVYPLPYLGELLKSAVVLLLELVTRTTTWIAGLPGAYPDIRPTLPMVLLLYVLFCAAAVHWLWRWPRSGKLALTAVMLLVLLWGMQAARVNRASSFTLYDERYGVMASMVNGREWVVLGDLDTVMADPHRHRKILQHQRSIGAHEPSWLHPGNKGTVTQVGHTLAAADRWMAPGLDVLFVSEGGAPMGSDQGPFDAVIFHDMRRISEDQVEAAARSAKWVVLAGRIPWRVRERVARQAAALGVQVHDVFAQGAFLLNAP
jgi:competence protein ComEC